MALTGIRPSADQPRDQRFSTVFVEYRGSWPLGPTGKRGLRGELRVVALVEELRQDLAACGSFWIGRVRLAEVPGSRPSSDLLPVAGELEDPLDEGRAVTAQSPNSVRAIGFSCPGPTFCRSGRGASSCCQRAVEIGADPVDPVLARPVPGGRMARTVREPPATRLPDQRDGGLRQAAGKAPGLADVLEPGQSKVLQPGVDETAPRRRRG